MQAGSEMSKDKRADKSRSQPDKGRRPRSRYRQEGGGGKLPRLFLLAAGGGLIGAVLLYWDCGGDSMPTGIGESLTVVSVNDSTGNNSSPIRSGDVEISMARSELVPEKVAGAAADQGTASTQRSSPAQQDSPAQHNATPKQNKPPTSQAPVPQTTTRIEAKASGSWAVQVGAFGNEDNAHALLARLQDMNFPAKLRAGNKAGGGVVYRVWIGFFVDRKEAETYARQNRAKLGETIAVHR